MKALPITLFIAAFLPLSVATAQAPVTDDCIIRDFKSDITLQKDSSLNVIEDLSLDCGDLTGKHGFFRILPTKAPQLNLAFPYTPVTLDSITDPSSGATYKYQTLKSGNTITWKIGDPDVTVTGVHQYRIAYRYQNTVGTQDSKDRFYWNLSGNFWDLSIEKFSARIHFPTGLNDKNVNPVVYSGKFGSNTGIGYDWADSTTLGVETGSLDGQEGVTLDATFPQGSITKYQPTLLQLYGGYFYYLPALLVLVMAFRLWKKYGQDPKLGWPEVVQYEPPDKLRPMELGLVETFGMMRNQFLAATIIDLAVRGFLKIKELPKEGLLGKADWELTKLNKSAKELKPFEQKLVDALFRGGETTTISEQKNSFYTEIPDIKRAAVSELEKAGIFDPSATHGWVGLVLTAVGAVAFFSIIGTILVLFSGLLNFFPHGLISVILTVLALVLAGVLMPRRTRKGAELEHALEGFKMYLSRAEKYRMQFYEKENIFEKYLPYAVAFALTDKWIKAFRQIASSQYQAHYVPIWYVGAMGSSFSVDGFTSQMNNIASEMSHSLAATPGGSGGGGFSGGGGGGGGGGSW